jgi:hypothetical protein
MDTTPMSLQSAEPKSKSPVDALYDEVRSQIDGFCDARLLRRVEQGELALSHYHAILTTLFHQTYSSPYTFARAAVNCSWKYEVAKEYLLQHAEEERTHWRWVLDDLRATRFSGPDPRSQPPHLTTQAYIGLNYYVAETQPVARLAIAAVLEGIGATHGALYGRQMLGALKLRKEQASFFLSHAETDKVHTAEIRATIERCSLSSQEWQWMNYAARAAGTFYRAMYDHEGFR